jgi:hypothetical protein
MTFQAEPLAYFLTWVTYGTWLPGDVRGWVEYSRGWQIPDPIREMEAKARMTEGVCYLSTTQRAVVEEQIAETCELRGWKLHAVNCRSNHVHVVITAVNTEPNKVRRDLKAWATRRLCDVFDTSQINWWAERGSIRHIHDQFGLEAAILYVLEGQDFLRPPPPSS